MKTCLILKFYFPEKRNFLKFAENLLKGTVDFFLWFYSSIDPIWASFYFTTFLSNSVSNSPSFEFEIRTALWTTAENQIFLADTGDLKFGWCRPPIVLFIYIHFFSITVPLKDVASF